MRNADGRQPEGRPDLQREPGTTRMVAAGGIHQHDVGNDGEPIDRRLQEWPFAQCQQPWRIRRAGRAGHDRLGEHAAPAQYRGRCPRLVALSTSA
jgi:hypothetical protein